VMSCWTLGKWFHSTSLQFIQLYGRVRGHRQWQCKMFWSVVRTGPRWPLRLY